MPCQDVDNAAFTTNSEGNFGGEDPFAIAPKEPCDRLVQSRMTSVEEPIEIRAIPANVQIEAATQCLDDANDCIDLQLADSPVLDI